jgi:hypothetical protein
MSPRSASTYNSTAIVFLLWPAGCRNGAGCVRYAAGRRLPEVAGEESLRTQRAGRRQGLTGAQVSGGKRLATRSHMEGGVWMDLGQLGARVVLRGGLAGMNRARTRERLYYLLVWRRLGIRDCLNCLY